MEKFQENLEAAIKHLQIGDHMTYVTYPIINENRLLIKIFEEIHKSIINCINCILNYEYLYKRIKLYTDNKENLLTFFNKSSKEYGLNNEQIQKIKDIMKIYKKHLNSSMEFVKKDQLVILSDNLQTQTISILKIKEYLLVAKELLMKTKNKINN
jgi:hypothetical protein